MSNIILEVKDLKKYFKTSKGLLHAVDNLNFTIERNKTLGVVCESGCGKSTLGRTILRLLEPTSGEVWFEGRDITQIRLEEMRKLRKEMQIIFQDPYSSLDPRKTVSEIISVPLKLHKIMNTDFIGKYRLRKITLHGLRHTFATQLLTAGVPLAVVSAWLGHSQRSTTLNIYTHPSDKGFTMGAEIINNVLKPSPAKVEKCEEQPGNVEKQKPGDKE